MIRTTSHIRWKCRDHGVTDVRSKLSSVVTGPLRSAHWLQGVGPFARE